MLGNLEKYDSMMSFLPPKFAEIFRFELHYQLRHVSTWLLFAIAFLFGFFILRMITLTDDTHLNAPGTIAFFTVFGSVIWVIIGGGIAGEAATRDLQTHMHPFTYTAPVSKFSYLAGRFAGALTLNACILLFLYAGMVLSFYGPGARTGFIGPFRLASYLTNFAFLALPTVLVTTSIQFALAALTGRAISGYIASILIIIFSQFGGTTVRFLLEWKVLGSLMDLLGTSIMADMEGWTPLEKNTRLITLEGIWLWNRVLWLTITAASLTITYYKFALTHVGDDSRWRSFFRRRSETKKQKLNTTSPPKITTEIIPIPTIERPFHFSTNVSQTLAIASASFKMIAKSWGGLTLVALLAIGTGLFATEYMEWFGVPLIARTQEVLTIITPSLNSLRTQWIIIPLLTIFYAGKLVWREREAGTHELTDTMPLRESVMFLGKFLGLSFIIILWVAFLMLAGIINQLVMAYHNFEIDVYLKALFGMQLINYLLFALLVFVLHVFVNQKYIGYIMGICAYAFILFASMIGVEHNLLIYASDTGWSYSDMRGFAPFIKPWLSFKFYWASWALFLGLFATLFWVRNKETQLRLRILQAKHRFKQHRIILLVAVVLLVASGSFIYYNTNVLHTYLSSADRMQLRAEYERRYGQYEHTPQPALAAVNFQVEIYPEEETAEIRGTYHLINRDKVSISSIYLSTVPLTTMNTISFDQAFTPAVVDDKRGFHIYKLNNPLKPGDSLNMRFHIQIKRNGFSNHGADVSVIGNGSHITSDDWMPAIGYDEDRRVRLAVDREKFALPPRALRPSLYDMQARHDTRHASLIEFEAVVSTAPDQVAVAPGALQRTWVTGGRRYFHYKTNAPINNDYAFFSAKYALHEAEWVPSSRTSQDSRAASIEDEIEMEPVLIQIYHHPTHRENVARMMKSAKASLDYYSREFGQYPYSNFRVLERPGAGRGMHADPMTIDYQEGYALMNPKPGGLDLPYHIMAHEVAHQWWGLAKLVPAAVEGSGFLVESLATYSAMQVVEETLGYDHLQRYLSQMRLEYEVPHSRAAPPLLQANNAFMNYRKGPFALFAMRHYIGQERVNDALRNMLKKSTLEGPLPTTLDFYRELRAITPDSLHYLAHDLFAANTFWELEAEIAKAIPAGEDTWQVSLEVEARKVTVDSIGNETNIPMNDWIEIGVYAPRKKGESSSRVLYLQKHRIASGKQTIIVKVEGRPARAGIDPNHLLIDLELENNTKKVAIDGNPGNKTSITLVR